MLLNTPDIRIWQKIFILITVNTFQNKKIVVVNKNN